MDRSSNPYLPGAGLRPGELAGRDYELETFDVLRARAVSRRPAQSLVLTGLRGVGKTVLLNEMADTARQDAWIIAKIEADLGHGRASFRQQVSQALTSSLRDAQRASRTSAILRAAVRTVSAFSVTADAEGRVSVTVSAEQASGRADSGNLQADLVDLAIDLGAAALDLERGVCVLIDEMQHLNRDELAAVCQACHEAGQRNLPFFVVGAGLPSLPGALADAKSYAERLFEYLAIGRLDNAAASAALTHPATEEGVEWEPEAVRLILEASGGYPYFIQQFGKTTWDTAAASPIRVRDATAGIEAGRASLDAGFFRARWERATPLERDYLTSMASDGEGPSSTGKIAQRLDKKQASLGPTRAKLIAKGLVYAPEHGQIAFTVPGMADFIRRQA